MGLSLAVERRELSEPLYCMGSASALLWASCGYSEGERNMMDELMPKI